MSERYIVAVCRSDRSRELRAYLYSHTIIVEEQVFCSVTDASYTLAVMRTTADSDDRADFLANYQADRLASGVFSPLVFDTYQEARVYADIGWGVQLPETAIQ